MDRKVLSLSRRTSSGVCTELPVVLVMAARDDTLTETPAESLDVPKSVAAMRRHKEWTTCYLPALKDEIGGLRAMGTWEEVDRSPDMVPIRTHMVATNRSKWKLRIVGQGNRTAEGIHFIISAMSMAGGIAVKMVFSFCPPPRRGVRC